MAKAKAVARPAQVSAAGELLTVAEVGAILGRSHWRIYELIREGRLPVRRLGRNVTVPRRALERWLTEAPPEAKATRPRAVVARR